MDKKFWTGLLIILLGACLMVLFIWFIIGTDWADFYDSINGFLSTPYNKFELRHILATILFTGVTISFLFFRKRKK